MTDEEQHTDPEPWPAGLVSPRELRGYVERGEITTVRLAVPLRRHPGPDGAAPWLTS